LGGIIDLGVAHEVLTKSGTWYSYKGERIGQGRENTRKFLQENPALANEVEARIREKLMLPLREPEEAKNPSRGE
jgi:recombination protein RecA